MMAERSIRPLAWLLAGSALVLETLLAAPISFAQPPEPHQYIEEYVGPSTCETCHGDVTTDVIHTVHYTWEEKMDHYSPIPATIARINWLGMLNEKLGIPGGCARCHVGDGSMPKPPDEVTAADRSGIDCLICHSPVYDTGLRFPVRNQDGTWSLTQDRSVLAARQAQRPADENCLFCHFNVGGGPLLKRGVDFAPVSDKHGEESKGDVHAEAGMVCVDCHGSQDHKVTGFGPTIWSRDLPDQRLTCDGCHTSTPHQDAIIDRHTRLDCRTCHVQGTGGLVFRDWTASPEYDPLTELYSPVSDVREANSVQPVYRWFNGSPVKPGEPWPADRTDEASRLQPFKQYDAVVPVDAASGQPIPLKLGLYYVQGDLEQAIEAGAADSGMDYSGDWEPKDVSALLQISHGIVGPEQALYCQDCHVPGGLMDFEALGYVPSEVDLLTKISSSEAGVRNPLQVQVVIPEPQPLPTPVLLSGDLEATRGLGIRVPWSPVLVVLAGLGMIAFSGAWLWRQKPARQTAEPPGMDTAEAPVARSNAEAAAKSSDGIDSPP